MQGLKQDVQDLKDGQVRLEQRLDRVERNQAQDSETLGEISARINEVLADHDIRIDRLEKYTGLSHS